MSLLLAFLLAGNAVAGDVTPAEITYATLGTESGGNIPIDMGLTEAGAVSYVIVNHLPTGITRTQLLAGKDETGANAAGSGAVSIPVNGPYSITPPAGLNGNYWIAFNSADAAGNRSNNITILGPIALNTTSGTTPALVYVGEAHSATIGTFFTFDQASANGGRPLPAIYTAGRYGITVTCNSALPSAVTIDGQSAGAAVDSILDNPESAAYYEVTIPGGGTGQITVTFPSNQGCTVQVVRLDAITRVATLKYNRQVGTTTMPLNDSGTVHLTTSAGDMAFCVIHTADTAPGAITGMTLMKPTFSVGTRQILGAINTNCAGGDPETMTLTTSGAFKWTTSMIVQYRAT